LIILVWLIDEGYNYVIVMLY